MNPAAGLRAVIESPAAGIVLTLVVYWLAQKLWLRTRRFALLHPVPVSIVVIAVTIEALGISYETYMQGARFIDLLLGPATVALALPLYRQRAAVREAGLMVIAATVLGSALAIAAGYLITLNLGGSDALALSMAPKSVTTPVAIELSAMIGGIPPLTIIFVIVAGTLGAAAAPSLLTLMRVDDPRVRGLAIGLSSHGVGTARALQESEQAGAFSGLSMALTALFTSLVMSPLITLLS